MSLHLPLHPCNRQTLNGRPLLLQESGRWMLALGTCKVDRLPFMTRADGTKRLVSIALHVKWAKLNLCCPRFAALEIDNMCRWDFTVLPLSLHLS